MTLSWLFLRKEGRENTSPSPNCLQTIQIEEQPRRTGVTKDGLGVTREEPCVPVLKVARQTSVFLTSALLSPRELPSCPRKSRTTCLVPLPSLQMARKP